MRIARRAQAGPQVLGYYHSHPRGPAHPSVTDRDEAAHDGLLWAIIAPGELRNMTYRSGVTTKAALPCFPTRSMMAKTANDGERMIFARDANEVSTRHFLGKLLNSQDFIPKPATLTQLSTSST